MNNEDLPTQAKGPDHVPAGLCEVRGGDAVVEGAEAEAAFDAQSMTRELLIKDLVDKFLTWPLPDSVCSDLCATKRGYPHRSGTTLLTAIEAKRMLEHVLANVPLVSPARRWTGDIPDKEGWYWYRDDKNDTDPIIYKVWSAQWHGEMRWYAGDENGGIWINPPCFGGEWSFIPPPQDAEE